MTISEASAPLSHFRVEDTLTDAKLLYLPDSQKLENDAFTGVITFKNTNATNPKYTITPTVVADTTAKTTKLVWKVDMKDGRFMPGDVLTIFFKVKKISSSAEKNIAKVCYPTPSQNEKCEEDPAEITPPSGWGGWGGGWSGGWGWGVPSCGNGRKDWNEICDLGQRGGKIWSDWRLFSNDDIYEKKYAGMMCTKSCGIVGEGVHIAPQCFNVQNGSISIMKGEVLPFYWNMEGKLWETSVEERIAWFKKHYAFSEKDAAEGKIDLASMRCTFKVYAPGQQVHNKVAYMFTVPCMNVGGWEEAGFTPSAIKDWIDDNKKGRFGGSELANQGVIKNVFDSLDNQNNYPILLPLSSKLYIKNFGSNTQLSDGKTNAYWNG